LSVFKILLPYAKRHRWAIFCGVVFVFLTNFLGPTVPAIIGETVNLAEHRRITSDELFTFSFLILILATMAACFRFLMRRVLIDVSREIEYELRNDLFKKLESLDPSFFDSNSTGDLMSRATNDMDMVRMLIGPSLMYSANTIFSLPMVLLWMLVLDWRLTIVAMIPMIFLPPLVKYFGKHTHKASREQQDCFGELTTMVQENFAGIRVVKAYQQEPFEEKKFYQQNSNYIDISIRLAKLQSLFFPSIRFMIGWGFLFLLVYGGKQIIDGELAIGTLLSFILLFGMVIWPMIAAGWVVNMIQRGIASLERINMIFDAQPTVSDSAIVEQTPLPDRPDIQIKNLTFQYVGTSEPQLSTIDLDVPAGKTVGIVGRIGSGKSTLTNLLGRLYPVERGMITFAGKDINDWPTSEIRKKISFVFQETFLFSDTISWNIRFGANENTPFEDVEQVARIAHVHDDILEFPKGYETVLGERGVNLSGGQKQRVSIARALLREADILVLDDSLSAVDTHTEEAILNDLNAIMKGKTTFLISHRISTVALADEIIVLEDGIITQRGTHNELIKKEGLYAELYEKQLSESQLDEQFELEDGNEGAVK
jgi:ATP-binding cassette, subfamily B, multidrug efflux pump